MLLDELDRLLTVAGLAHDVIALLAEHLGEVESDQGLVLGDHHARACEVSGAVSSREQVIGAI